MKHKGLFELILPPPPPPTEIDRIIEQHAQGAADKWHRHVEQVMGTPFIAPCDLKVERVGLTDDGKAQVVFRATGTVRRTRLIGRFIKVPKWLHWLCRELPLWVLIMNVVIALVIGFQLGVWMSE